MSPPGPEPPQWGHTPPEVVSAEVVEQGVEAAVEADQGHGDAAGLVDGICPGAVEDDVHAAHQMQQVDRVVRQEAQQRDGQDGVDHAPRLARRARPDAADAAGHQRVAHQDNHRGHQRAEHQAEDAVGPQTPVPLLLTEALEAPLLLALGRVGQDEGQRGDGVHQPNAGTDQHGAAGVPQAQVGERVHSGQVAVHADAGHEGDAGVDVGMEDGAGEDAHWFAQTPDVVMPVVVDAEGQSAQEHCVHHGQVDDIDFWGRSLLPLGEEAPESRQVARQPKDHHQAVDNREEVKLEVCFGIAFWVWFIKGCLWGNEHHGDTAKETNELVC